MPSKSVLEVFGWEPASGALAIVLVGTGSAVSGSLLSDPRLVLLAALLAVLCAGWELWRRRLRLRFERVDGRVLVTRRGAVVERLWARDVSPTLLEVRLVGTATIFLVVGGISFLCLLGAVRDLKLGEIFYFSGGCVGLFGAASSALYKRWRCVRCEIPFEGEAREVTFRRADLDQLLE